MRQFEENKKTKYSKCDGFIMMAKSMVERFGFIKHSSEIYDGQKIVAGTKMDF